MSDPVPAVEHVAEVVATDAEHVAAAVDPQVADAATVAHDAEHVAEVVAADVPAAQRIVAAVSRNADGTIRESGARLVGDREELVGYFHRQLVSVGGAFHSVADLLQRAETEVDAMLCGHRPPAEPVVTVTHPFGAPVVDGPAPIPAAPETPAPPAAPETPAAP